MSRRDTKAWGFRHRSAPADCWRTWFSAEPPRLHVNPIFRKGPAQFMPETVKLSINGKAVEAPRGTTVAAAIMSSGIGVLRRSVTGEPRGALCGMGACFECRVTIDDVPHRRSCQILCADGMKVVAG